MRPPVSRHTTPFRLLEAYTGATSIEKALEDDRAIRLLWLEILVNDALDLTAWRDRPEIVAAHAKACRWYTAYRTLINSLVPRSPLPADTGPTDPKDFRVFAEALRFVADHH
ncbi:MAG: hypothetical protein ACOYXU_13410 [Nitrospirota bacterium]